MNRLAEIQRLPGPTQLFTLDAVHGLFVQGTITDSFGGPVIGGKDMVAISYDAAGGERWVHKFGTTADDESLGMAIDPAGAAILVGVTQGNLASAPQGEGDAFVRKLTPQGQVEWTRQIGSPGVDTAWGATTDASGNIFIAGTTEGGLALPAEGDFDAFLAKYSSAGEAQWIRQLDLGIFAQGRAAALDHQGNIYLAGEYLTTDGESDSFLAKYDADGNFQWTRQRGAYPAAEHPIGVATDAQGNIYMAGTTLSASTGFEHEGYLCKYDSVGNQLWTQYISTPTSDEIYGLALDSNGHAYVSGITRGSLGKPNPSSLTDAYIRRFDPDGGVEETFQFGSMGPDFVNAMNFTAAGELVMAGYLSGTYAGQTNAAGRGFMAILRDVEAADFDADGVVAGGDFLRWQRELGVSPHPTADGNEDGVVDELDLAAWQAAFNAASAPNAAGIPEPHATVLLAWALVGGVQFARSAFRRRV